MTMKLTAKRFRIRRPEAVVPPAPKADGAAMFEPREDGFGDQRYPTAGASPA